MSAKVSDFLLAWFVCSDPFAPENSCLPRRLMSLIGLTTALALATIALSAGNAVTEKILRRTLFRADQQTYRYSGGSLLRLADRRALLMAVSVFGSEGGEHAF